MWGKCGYAPTGLLGFDPECKIASPRYLGRSDKLRDILPVSLIYLYVNAPYSGNFFSIFFSISFYFGKEEIYLSPKREVSVYLGKEVPFISGKERFQFTSEKEVPFISEKRGFVLTLRGGFVRLYS